MLRRARACFVRVMKETVSEAVAIRECGSRRVEARGKENTGCSGARDEHVRRSGKDARAPISRAADGPELREKFMRQGSRKGGEKMLDGGREKVGF